MSTTRDLPLLPEIVTGAAKLAVSAAGGKSGDLWMIPPDHVHIDPLDNVRPLDPKHVKHLSMLIEEHGFDKSQPLGCIVKRIDGQDLVYVYSGQHRYHAAMLAIERGVHIRALPCVIRDAKTVNRRSLIITGVNNNSSEPLSPLDLAGAIDALKREGLTETEITQQLHITQQTVRDVMLLAAAPVQIHTMIRKNQIKSTLAIEQIRKHGPDKAAQLLERTVDAAQAKGKTKITKKDLPKTLAIDPTLDPAPHRPTITMLGITHASPNSLSEVGNRRYTVVTVKADLDVPPKVTNPKAMFPHEPHVVAAYAALRAVASDPSFRDFSVRIRDQVLSAIESAPAPYQSDLGRRPIDRPVDIANEHGVFDSCEAIEVKGVGAKAEKATISVAQSSPGVWIYGYLYGMGCSGASMCSVIRGEVWATRQSAITAAAFDLIGRCKQDVFFKHRKAKPLIAALEAVAATPDPDMTGEIADDHGAFRENVECAETLGARDKVVTEWIERRRAQCEGAAK